jgi:hypothetical protein
MYDERNYDAIKINGKSSSVAKIPIMQMMQLWMVLVSILQLTHKTNEKIILQEHK